MGRELQSETIKIELQLSESRVSRYAQQQTIYKHKFHEKSGSRRWASSHPSGDERTCGLPPVRAWYANRRWNTAQSEVNSKGLQPQRAAQITICPACKQASSGEPRGFVYLDGAFLVGHREDIKKLMLNEVKRAGEDNPMARILELKEGDGHQLTVTTTTEHLAQRLGHALEKAFGGEVVYNFSHENKIARVSWVRE